MCVHVHKEHFASLVLHENLNFIYILFEDNSLKLLPTVILRYYESKGGTVIVIMVKTMLHLVNILLVLCIAGLSAT